MITSAVASSKFTSRGPSGCTWTKMEEPLEELMESLGSMIPADNLEKHDSMYIRIIELDFLLYVLFIDGCKSLS